MATDLEAIKKLSVSRTRLVDEVTESLRGLILGGKIEPGTQLLQIELAEMLGVSRTPLREAFRLLEQDGLIRVANGNRTVEVVDPNPTDLAELHDVREVIDGLAASLCAQRELSKSEMASLTTPMQKMERWTAKRIDGTAGPGQTYVDAHAAFHVNMVTCSGNVRLTDLISVIQMSSQMGMARYVRAHRPELLDELRSAIPEMVAQSDRDHQKIVQAIMDGDHRLAERAAREHVGHLAANVARFTRDDH